MTDPSSHYSKFSCFPPKTTTNCKALSVESMSSKENPRCPHFGTQDGVCGCPGFWQDANCTQGTEGLALQEVSNTGYGQAVRTGQRSSGVNATPLHDRTKGPAVTPAPPGPPKDTCFFWYHGTCRRGSECDRPHEAHPTWPISPPPGFRHYEPCMLPLCPLRADLQGTNKPQEYQRGRRAIGGQMDGAAFSRSTTGGESSSDLTSDGGTDTDLSEAGEDASSVTEFNVPDVPPRHSAAPDGRDDDGEREGAEAAGEVKAELKQGRNDLHAPNYLDLSSCVSPPSTPLVQEETILSISHPGTLGKCVHLSTATSPESTNKRTKLKRSMVPDLKDVSSILEHRRTISQWDINSPVAVLDRQHPETKPANSKPSCSLPSMLDHMPAAGGSSSTAQSQPFDPPKGPRSMSVLPPICFFYYHKGHCRPKRGRRCDYLHDTSTAQQTVSLPHGIENHDPICPLPRCPIRMRNLDRPSAELEPLRVDVAPEVKHEFLSPSAPRATLLPDWHSSSLRHENMSVQDRPLGGMLSQPLPHMSGKARQHFKKQKRMMTGVQAIPGIDSGTSAPTDGSAQQNEARNQTKKSRKGKKKRARAKAAGKVRLQLELEGAPRHALDTPPGPSTTQVPLPSLSLEEEVSTYTSPLVSDISVGERETKRGGKDIARARAGHVWIREIVNGEGFRDHIFGEQQARFDEDIEVVRPDAIAQQPHRRYMSAASSQRSLAESIVRHEYLQESLGLTVDQRRQSIFDDIAAELPAVAQALLLQSGAVTPEGTAASIYSPQTQWEGQDQSLLHKPRYLEGCVNEMDCGRQNLCQNCEATGVAVDSNADRAKGNTIGGASTVFSQANPSQQPPQGDQRLDWDTDLVRRLFGEIE